MALVGVAGLWSSPLETAPACLPKELVTRFGDWTAESILVTKDGSQSVQPATVNGDAPEAMRLLISAPQPGQAPWKLTIRNGAGHLLALIDQSQFPDAIASLWTGRLDASRVTLSLRGGDDQTQIEVRGALALPKPGKDEAIFSIKSDKPDWRSLYPTTSAMQSDLGEAVGMLSAGKVEGAVPQRATWCCTGVMVGSDLFMTNWHCGGGASGEAGFGAEVASGAIVDLEWETGSPVRRQFYVTKLELSDEKLDFAILRVHSVAGGPASLTSAVPVKISTAPPTANEAIFMIHHAQCLPKLVSTDCRVVSPQRQSWIGKPAGASDRPELTHDCDTEPGASGAPIFNADGQLIALHHLGFATGPQCTSDRLNKAVKIGAIAARVRAVRPDIANQLGW